MLELHGGRCELLIDQVHFFLLNVSDAPLSTCPLTTSTVASSANGSMYIALVSYIHIDGPPHCWDLFTYIQRHNKNKQEGTDASSALEGKLSFCVIICLRECICEPLSSFREYSDFDRQRWLINLILWCAIVCSLFVGLYNTCPEMPFWPNFCQEHDQIRLQTLCLSTSLLSPTHIYPTALSFSVSALKKSVALRSRVKYLC